MARVLGGAYYYHNDHLGTPYKITAPNGAVVWSAHYSAFGAAQVSPDATVTNNLRYAGQYFDEETGLHYNWRRYYDPATGRYITVDPVGIGGAGNLYAYAEANPITYIDPTGECAAAGIASGMAMAKLEAELTGECFEYHWYDAVLDGLCVGAVYKGVKLAVKHGDKLLKKGKDVVDKVKDKLKKKKKDPSCPINSFTGDTLVHTREGLKPIREVREGDEVLSFAEWSGEQSYQKVEAIITGEKEYRLILIRLADGALIEATDGHPFQVYGKGWRDADRLYLQDKGLVRIAGLKAENRHERVFNLSVANTHTYYVGVDGVLVHNADGDDDVCLATAYRKAVAARKELAETLHPLKGKAPATVTAGYNVKTGEVAAKACGGRKCAENHVVEALGGNKDDVRFTKAERPRNFNEVPVCETCEATYGRDAFPPGTRFKSDE